ncbi:MAG: zf-HC2 domain-containing protein [Armatimonadetes bacterium]|nr:zf-HC2 domain-containing protein [Armatimonadota bacterium]
MRCESELLQAFLDGELAEQKIREVKEHLAACRACRRELSRLKLLWLELARPEAIPLPPELPYLRQQAIAAARPAPRRPEKGRPGFWDIQKLAWRPLSLTTAYLPGSGEVKELVKAAGRKLPGLLLGSLTLTGRLWRLRRAGGKGRGRR